MSEVETLRIFVALELDPETRASLADLSTRLQKAALFTPARFSWVPESNLHLTLFFLGPISVHHARNLLHRTSLAVAECAPFEIDVRHLGYFPSAGEPPRVLWTGIHNPPPELTALRARCADAIADAGLPVPDQQFTPHNTLARIKSTKGLREFQKATDSYRFTKCGKSLVKAVTVMESVTGDGPATYRPFGHAPLKDCTR